MRTLGVLAKWGANIGAAREALGMTQQELAEALEVSYPTVWRWEKGKMEPRRQQKQALANLLHRPINDLFPMAA